MEVLVFVLSMLAITALIGLLWVEKDRQKKIAVLQWVDQREVLQAKLAVQVAALRSLGAVPHIGSIDGVRDYRFGPNGPSVFIPSDTGLKQIALAMNILQERENLYQQMRDGIMKTYGELVNWERLNPVPDGGTPYPSPSEPEVQYPKQDTKPAPRPFLDAPSYNKELNR